MNCPKCNTLLETNARFCPRCGEPISGIALNNTPANPASSYPPAYMGEPPTLPLEQQRNEPLVLRPGYQQVSQPPAHGAAPQWSQSQAAAAQSQQPPYYQTGVNTLASNGNTRPRRRGRGCLVGFITLLVLLLLLVGGWFLLLRPYLNDLAKNKLDNILTDAVNHIPPQVALAPAGPVNVSENLLNNLLVLSSSPNDIVKNTQIHITPNTMSMQFQVYGFTGTVNGVPKVQQGRLVITNVTVDGIAGLILSPEDITALANKHLAAAQTRINHAIVSVQMKNQELDLVFGAAGSNPTPGGSPGGLPPIGTPTLPVP
jgi:zinc-ribbon domain